MFISKQELKSVPLQLLYEKVTLATSRVEHDLLAVEKYSHKKLIERKEKEWADTHEAPFEGNFEDLYPFVEPDPAVISKAKERAKHEAVKLVLEEVLAVKKKASWLLPQMAAYIAKMELPRNEKGLIDPKQFRVKNFGKDDWHKGLYYLAMSHQRGLLVPTQTDPEFKNYMALVPLLMMPAKKFNKIDYSEWDTEGLAQIVDPNLYEAMTYPNVPELSNEEILEIRTKGLSIGSGQKRGTFRNPVTTHMLYAIQGTPVGEMPWLCQVMYTQIWGAHPANRTNLMILDWKNWDNLPKPIIESELMEATKRQEDLRVKYSSDELPWDA